MRVLETLFVDAAVMVDRRDAADSEAPQSSFRRDHRRVGLGAASAFADKERFTALLHHVTIDLLKGCLFLLKREAAPGWMVEHGKATSRTWKSNLAELHCASIGAPIERSLHDALHPKIPIGGNARWGSPRWKIRSSFSDKDSWLQFTFFAAY